MRTSCAVVYLVGVLGVFFPRGNVFGDEAAHTILVTPRAAEDEAVFQALAKRKAWKFSGAPLAAVQAEFTHALGINVVLDRRALELAGATLETTISLDLREASARTALDLVCREAALAWLVRDGLLCVTTPEAVEQAIETRVYDVATICPTVDGEGIELPYIPDSMFEMITSVVAPTSWTATGGYGGLNEFTSDNVQGLVIPQTFRNHESIEQLLTELALLRRTVPAHGRHGTGQQLSPREAREARILKALQMRKDWELHEQPLTDGLAIIEEAIGIDVVLDPRIAAQDFRSLATPIHLHQATALAALETMLPTGELTWTTLDDLILVTSVEEAGLIQAVRVYDVGDIYPSQSVGGHEIDFDFDSMIELITSSVDPTSWPDVGGEGAIQEFESGPLKVVVVTQTPRNHAAIAKLLADLRAIRTRSTASHAAQAPVAEVADANGDEKETNSPQVADGGDLTDESRRFAVKLYREMASQEKENFLVSPYSAFDALGMVYVGAGGKTAEELAAALECTGLPQEMAAEMFGRLRRTMLAHARAGKNELWIANRLWGQEGYPFRPEYLQTLDKQFDSLPESINFMAADNAALRINKWAYGATAGRIADVVDPRTFDEATRFVLTNAAYFKANWKSPFLRGRTRRGAFKSPDGETYVRYMQQSTRCQYAEAEGLQLASLPYKGDRFSMLILLPQEGVTAKHFEEGLTAQRLRDWSASLRTRDVDLMLPKFRFETQKQLNPALQALGAPSMFDVRKADLTGISALAAKESLSIEEVRQSTFIEINEDGTEAAAVTSGGGFGGAIGPKEPKQVVSFHAERPFLFLIRDDETGVILFMGRVMKPENPEENPSRR